jgi:integrase
LDHKETNTATITKYLKALEVEVNPSKSYQIITHKVLTNLSQFHGKSFTNTNREDILSYLNSLRNTDKMHSWIGTYNLHLVILIRFFKWIYNPNLEPKQRTKPQVVQNIPQLKRKEVSIYKPSDLWSIEDDAVFLKYCPSVRDRCYHAFSRDLSARPHEILNLVIRDIVFKQAGTKQYAEVLVNGKTGTRHLPIIDSLPYVKDWLDQHPRRNDSNAYFICSLDRKNFAKQMSLRGLQGIYKRYKDNYYLPLSKDSSIPNEDRQRINALLMKPWNPYIRRHSSLTAKSKFLHGLVFNQHAGWTPRSQMNLKYVHYFGNESSESILQEYGILPKDNEEKDILRPKYCTNCNTPNRTDQKFCVKCRMILSIEAFQETLEEQRKKDELTQQLLQRVDQMEAWLRDPEQFIRMRDEAFAMGRTK